MSQVLEVVGLQKRFGTRPVLIDVSLSAASGEAVALVGANGSGKTTMLRAIVGLSQPERGVIRVNGIDVTARPRDARQHLSYLPQRPAFPPTLTVRETIALVARLRGLSTDVVDREIDACGLTKLADAAVAQLSGGERQRVGLAVTFVADVPLYLFDEPSANLDPSASRILIDRTERLVRDGRTVVFTTHMDADVERLATRMVHLREGRLVSAPAVARHDVIMRLELDGDARESIAVCHMAGATDVTAEESRLTFAAPADRAGAIVEAVRQGGARIMRLKTVGRLERALASETTTEHQGRTDVDTNPRVPADAPARRLWWRIARAEAHPAGSR